MAKPSNPFRVLIVKDYSTTAAWGTQMVEAFIAHIRRSQPSANIEVCNVADGEAVPEFALYQLVVLTGGVLNLCVTWDPWVAGVLERVKELAATDSNTKLMGTCLGHQSICVALGGKLDTLAEGPRVGIQSLQLTPSGRDFFGQDTVDVIKFHKRYVGVPAPGYTPLAYKNEILISANGNVLSFQGHPELNGTVVQGLLEDGDGSYGVKATGEPAVPLRDYYGEHDGAKIWDRIMQWAAPRAEQLRDKYTPIDNILKHRILKKSSGVEDIASKVVPLFGNRSSGAKPRPCARCI